MRLVAYVRISRDDERPENQEYAVYRWAAERGHQVVEVVKDVDVSGALPPAQRPGWRRVLELLESADGIVVYALDRLARSLWDLAAVVKELEARGKLLLSVREEWLQSIDPKGAPAGNLGARLGRRDGAGVHTGAHQGGPRASEGTGQICRQASEVVGGHAPPYYRPCEKGPYAKGGLPARRRGLPDSPEVSVEGSGVPQGQVGGEAGRALAAG